jgi:hypothetical protein
MKKLLQFSFIIGAIFCFANMQAQDTIMVAGLPEAPTVDGEMDDMWDNIKWVEINEGAPISTDDSDFYTRMKIAWNGDHIYMLVERVDDTLTYGADAKPYHQDYVTLYIDADGYSGLAPSYDNAQVWWARSTYDGEGGFGGDGRTGDPDNGWVGYDYFAPVLTQEYTVDGATVLTEYSLETAVAGFTDDLSTEVDDEFGFEFEIGDTDDFEEGTDNRKYMHFINPDGTGGVWDDVTQFNVAVIDEAIEESQEPVGIDQSLASENGKLFPNPAVNSVQFSSDQVVNQVSIYNVTGSIVLSKTVNSQNGEVNISGLKAGLYFVKLSMGNSSNVIKLLKK